MIKITQASKSFGSLNVFNKIDFIIDKPGLYVIQGESGSGKSTFLNLLAGYESFDEGNVDINQNITAIFQNYELIDELTAKENIFLTNENPSLEEIEIVHKLGLDELMEHYCDELSGGQKQRIGIARALLLNPNIILCDEPTESLDIDNKHIVMNLLKELSKNKVVIIASHDQQMIDAYAKSIYKIENHRLIKVKQMDEDREFEIHDKKLVNKKNLSKLIHKIIKKKTALFSFILVILVLLFQGLYIFQKSLFYQSNTANTVNADMGYVKLNNKDVDTNLLLDNEGEPLFEKEKLIPIVNFIQVQVDGKQMLSNIYPYVENELKIEGKEPEVDEVIINQNVAETIGDWKNKEIEFNFILANQHLSKTFKISGVVYEEDTQAYNFYYDLDLIMDEFSQTYLSNGQSYHEYILENGTCFQIKLGYSAVENVYEQVLEFEPISLYNPLHEERLEFKQNSMIYRCLFIIFEVILIVGIIIFMLIYLYKDTNQFMSICSILISLQMPIQMVKRFYIKYKFLYFIPLITISTILLLGYHYHKDGFIHLTIPEFNYIFMIVMMLNVVYIATLIICLNKFKRNKISNILKNSKD